MSPTASLLLVTGRTSPAAETSSRLGPWSSLHLAPRDIYQLEGSLRGIESGRGIVQLQALSPLWGLSRNLSAGIFDVSPKILVCVTLEIDVLVSTWGPYLSVESGLP
jgi:hypothetical protein